MLSEFRKRKLAMAFYRLDTTKDGYLTVADMTLCGRRIAEAQGFTPGSNAYQSAVSPYHHAWETMLMPGDSQGVGQITLAEYIGRIEQLSAMPEMHEMAIQMNALFFDLVDLDKDGHITPEELVIQLGALGVHADEARDAFAKLDTNGDGIVNRDEYARALYDHHMSDDPHAPGNWVLGPF